MSDVVVSAEWLDECEDVRIVDVRDEWEFEGIGHVPGAVNIPFDSFRAPDGDEGMLPGEEVFADLLGEAGIERDDEIVAYDDTHGVFAARFLVTAECYGHDRDKLHLLDGDYSAWGRGHETITEPTTTEPVEYALERPDDTVLIDREAITAAVDDGDGLLVDTREAWEYDEGHIPGAIQLDWREFVDDETRGLKERAAIEEILDDHGIARDRRVILYCNTARRISHTYLVLRHLGFEDLGFYEGSLTEWEQAGGTVETSEDD
ncbi:MULTISPECIES: sulfurtransferase [Halococcus]|uniref:Rhodanese domain protein n=1 Tax=Halococcus salifodinae DSM 8989 TaxID=1227456 RepID=M0NEF3_9EURY|nr:MULTISPECIES: rhodanese-like domain-containing protein [Halococcus]EMA55045.1 Rhodanese domain protein [Halococcus salifodinae DSM 8989]